MWRSLLSMRSRMAISYLILRRRVSAVSKDVPQARMPFSADKETCMPLWTIDASAVAEDSRWLDFPIWEEVVVRAPTAAQARLVAAAMEAKEIADPTTVGNETLSFRSGFQEIGRASCRERVCQYV